MNLVDPAPNLLRRQGLRDGLRAAENDSAQTSAAGPFAGEDAQARLRRRIRDNTSRTDRTEDEASGRSRPLGGEIHE